MRERGEGKEGGWGVRKTELGVKVNFFLLFQLSVYLESLLQRTMQYWVEVDGN